MSNTSIDLPITPNERAADDYAQAIDTLAPLADYLVVNASSPNTPGLRELQEPRALEALLVRGRSTARGQPVFVKLSPDLAPEALRQAVDVSVSAGAQGVIVTNTTVGRPFTHPLAHQAGGLSGEPLRALSTECVRIAATHAAGRLAVIGLGGIFNEGKFEFISNALQCVHVSALPVKMHRQQGSNLVGASRTQSCLHAIGIQIQRGGIDVHQHRSGSRTHNGAR